MNTDLLNERAKTHGDFISGAETFYHLMKPSPLKLIIKLSLILVTNQMNYILKCFIKR